MTSEKVDYISFIIEKASKTLEMKKPYPNPWGAYHLHGKPGNSGWKMKWYIPLHLRHFLQVKTRPIPLPGKFPAWNVRCQ